MKLKASPKVHRLYVLVLMLALMGVALSARLHAQNHASSWDTPFHQNVPDDGEDNADSAEDSEADDEQDAAIVETGLQLQPLSIVRLNLLIDVHLHALHHVKITIPPPKRRHRLKAF